MVTKGPKRLQGTSEGLQGQCWRKPKWAPLPELQQLALNFLSTFLVVTLQNNNRHTSARAQKIFPVRNTKPLSIRELPWSGFIGSFHRLCARNPKGPQWSSRGPIEIDHKRLPGPYKWGNYTKITPASFFAFWQVLQVIKIIRYCSTKIHLLRNEKHCFGRSLYVVVCRLSVCNVRAPYSGDLNFRQCFYTIWYAAGHLLTFR